MKTLRLLGLGNSVHEAKPNPEPGIDVWGLQYTWKSHKIHRAFVMDDREWIVAKNNNLGKNIQAEINSYDWPIYTAKLWGDLNNNVLFPLQTVIDAFPNLKHRALKKTDRGEEIEEIQGKYFLNTFCYMMALAIVEGYERIEIYGMDMADATNRKIEAEKALEQIAKTGDAEQIRQMQELLKILITWEDERTCVAYWVGVAIGRGIEVALARSSRVTKPLHEGEPVLYGYETSDSLNEVRKTMLHDTAVLESKLHSGKVTKIGNDTIVDVTDKNLKLSFYHKEDWPEGVKGGDISSPRNKPFYTTNEIPTKEI